MKRSIINYLYNAGYYILMAIVPLVTTPYISRVLLAGGIGVYSYTAAWANLFTIIAAMGINSYGQREIAKNREQVEARSKVFWELMALRLVSVLVCVIIYILLCVLINQYTMYLLIQGIAIISILFDNSWLFQGLELFKVVVLRNTVIKLSAVGLVFTFVKKETDLVIYVLIIALSGLMGNVALFFAYRKYICFVPFNELEFRKHIIPNFEFFLPVIAVQIYTHLDKIMLNQLGNNIEENGYYEQTRKIIDIIIRLIVSINTVLYPKVSYLLSKRDYEKVDNIYKTVYKIIISVALPVAVGLFITSDSFVLWFFGIEFMGVALLLKISAVMILFMCVGNFFGVLYYLPSGKQNVATLIYFVCAMVNIILNAFFIERFLAAGAVLSSLIAEILSCMLQMLGFLKNNPSFKIYKGIWKYVVSAFAMGGLLYATGVSSILGWMGTVISVFVGMFIYLFALFLLKDELIYTGGQYLKNYLIKQRNA